MVDLDKAKLVTQCWVALQNHPAFDQNPKVNFKGLKLLIDPVLENGKGRIVDDETKNVHLRYWYEILVPVERDGEVIYIHDYDLDGSADTYEDTIINIYKKVSEKYGKYCIREDMDEILYDLFGE